MIQEIFRKTNKKQIRDIFLFLTFQLVIITGFAQPGYWQQHVRYAMDIDMNVTTNRFTGKQSLDYTNHSPDTLKKVFYHLYWNAFQPNSMMDNHSRVLGQTDMNGRPDWDGRVGDRILNLQPEE